MARKENKEEVEQPQYDSGDIPTYLGAHGNKLVWLITATATTGFLLFGYDQGVMAGLITADQFAETFPAVSPEHQASVHGYSQETDSVVPTNTPAHSRAALIQATYTSIYEVGCLVGALGALIFGDLLGRRRMMFTGAGVMVIGTIIQVTAFAGHKAPEQFCVGRVITGVGNGLNTSTIPSWQAETSKSHNRGVLVCIEASMIAIGTVISYWIDVGLGYNYDPADVTWRFPIAFQIAFAVGLCAGVAFLPESPRWLLSKGHEDEGRRVVAALNSVPENSAEAHHHTNIMADGIRLMTETQGKAKRREVLTGGKTQHLRRTILGSSSQVFQQIGGCNAVIYFSPVIFQEYLGLERKLALILAGVNVSVYAICACVSYFIIERVGRRKMFLIGSFGQAMSMFILMGCTIPFGLSGPNDHTKMVLNGAVLGQFLFLAFFGATWLELPWLYPAEINPLRIRTNANAISTMSNWSWNFAVVQWTPPMLAAINWGTFLFFGIINLCFVPIVYLFYPETAGRSLEEIDVIFALGYTEGKSYVSVANSMPKLSSDEVKSEAARLGLTAEAKDVEQEAQTDLPAYERNEDVDRAAIPKGG
ncbi:putative MFS monosaccharide transporter [Wallemia mellicola]|uniref:MFS monosaccharide transporter n=1 Tax=Wallemia mellicola TaxID=1708541 RepID=A0AB38MWF3_9BASI|nr:putative MFS monosaccharide transporter [Wallemia mellicola]TIC64353.1 putative MFS monosaccharide transporter [Wallemia mellicola]